MRARFPLSYSERLCVAACVGLFLAVHLIVWGMDEAAYRADEAEKPPVELTWEAPMDQPQLLEAMVVQLSQPHTGRMSLWTENFRLLYGRPARSMACRSPWPWG